MKKETVKKFVKDHKKDILIALAGAVVGGCTVIAGKGIITKVISSKTVDGIERMPGFVIDGPLTLGDIGKLGEEFIKHDPNLTTDTKILAVGSFEFG